MFPNLIYFYKKNLSSYNLIFKHMKFIWCFYCALIIIIVFEVIRREGHFNFIANILFGALLVIASVGVGISSKRVMKKKYGVGSNDVFWYFYEFEELRKQLLKKYLDDKQLLSEKKLTLLISLANREAERKRFKGLIELGVFVALLAALWSPLFAWYLTYLNNLQVAFSMTLGFTIVLVQLCIIYLMTRYIIVDIMNTESKKISNMGMLLENIYFELLDEIEKEP
jgi:hypothetical protein